MSASLQQTKQIQEKYQQTWMEKKYISAVGMAQTEDHGEENYCLVIYFTDNKDHPDIPDEVDGILIKKLYNQTFTVS